MIYPYMAKFENGYAISMQDAEGKVYTNLHVLTA